MLEDIKSGADIKVMITAGPARHRPSQLDEEGGGKVKHAFYQRSNDYTVTFDGDW